MTVLVAYNDSPQGEAALHAAVGEALRRGVDLAILVLTPREPDGGVPTALAHLIDTFPPELAQTTVSYRDHGVDPADAILVEAAAGIPDVVVIGARKRSHVGKFLLGSTTQRVLLDSPAPVLVIKAKH